MQSDNRSSTVFDTLKYSGENFFENKSELDQVRKDSLNLHEFKAEFKGIDSPNKQTIIQFLFQQLDIDKPSDIKYEERRECRPEEAEIIKKECAKKGKSDHDIEVIKHALGFKSNYKTGDEFKKPCVAVVGQTKAGKSSLINALLGASTVPQKLTKQTARVTYVTYCDIEFVAYAKKVNRENQLTELRVDEKIQEEDVNLKFEDRRKAEQVNIEVRLGVKNPILQNGFDIVDSPGLNENPALNELCQKMEKSLVPLLIYVIDGRNGLTETDIADVKSIRERTPEIKILYFVTKLDRTIIDRAMYDRKKKRKNVPTDQDLPGENDIEVAHRRLNNVFWKLQRNAFVSPSAEFDKCAEFNGCNLAAIQLFRILDKEPATPIDKKSVEFFNKFEVNLCHDLKNMIEEPLNKDSTSLKTALESVLEKASFLASNITEEKHDKIMCLDRFSEDEKHLYETQSQKIVAELQIEITKMLNQYEASILQMVQSHEFRSSQRTRNVQSSGSRSGGGRERFDEEMLPQFRHEIREFIEKTLQTQMEDFIATFMWKCDDDLHKELSQIHQDFCSSGGVNRSKSSFAVMLKNRLYYSYDLGDECCVTHSGEYYYQQPVRRTRNNRILAGIRELIRCLRPQRDHPNQPTSSSSSNQPESEDAQVLAQRLLSDFDRKEFIQNISSKVTSGFEENHTSFINAMREEKDFLNRNWTVDDKEKDRLKTFSEEMAILYSRILMVNTKIHLPIDEKVNGEVIGHGTQATIEKVFLIGQREPIVKKTYLKKFKTLKEYSNKKKKALALEVYYTSRLLDERFLKLLGIKKECSGEEFAFSSFHPYYRERSLKEYLESHEVGKKTRLELAIDIADGLERLHKLQIIHRDITLKNILVSVGPDSKLQAVIGDFGILSSLGFADRQLHSTSANKADELFDEGNFDTMGYTFASDVYSFGISLWQLMSYRILREPEYENYEPRFIMDCGGDIEKIQQRKRDGCKPEERDAIPPDLRQLLEKCWCSKKERRLKMSEITKELKQIQI